MTLPLAVRCEITHKLFVKYMEKKTRQNSACAQRKVFSASSLALKVSLFFNPATGYLKFRKQNFERKYTPKSAEDLCIIQAFENNISE